MRIAAALLMLSPALAFAEPETTGPCERPCSAPRRPQLIVTVRQDLKPPLPASTLVRIAADVRKLWQPHVDIQLTTFADDAAGAGADDALTLLLTERESSRSGDGLGWIEFVDEEPARVITVSVARARTLAAAGSWQGRPIDAWPPAIRETFLTRALARGIAHEVGHYLLRSKTHTARGLMREVFSVAEIMGGTRPDGLFVREDLARLRQRSTMYMLARQGKSEAGPQ